MAIRVRQRETGEEKVISDFSMIPPCEQDGRWEKVGNVVSDPAEVYRRFGTGVPAMPAKRRDRSRRTHG